MSIGAVLAVLRPEFPDITISKIRFLEEQGLIEPDRTPSGYRKFTHDDVERLRYVLSIQRDHYMPLRVIRDHLDALDRGMEAPVTGRAPHAPRLVGGEDGDAGPADVPRAGPDVRLGRSQLCEVAGIDDATLRELETHGLVAERPGTGGFDADAVVIARTAGQLAAFGIGPRHLRGFRAAADREAGLVEQVVSPLRRQRSPEAGARAEEATREVADLCLRLHAALVKSALERM
jgi:DNA-binding transcriptional MerR regulator